MIHDACVEVTCDREGCGESIFVELEWVYRTRSELSGFYDPDMTKIENKLMKKSDWVVRDGRHFCTVECAEAK